MTKTCSQCGGINQPGAESCSFCDAPLFQYTLEPDPPREVRAPAPRPINSEPEWRREVARRLAAYRARRRRLRPGDSQALLPFRGDLPELMAGLDFDRTHSGRERPKQRAPVERVEIAVVPPDADFAGAETHPRSAQRGTEAAGHASVNPVAALRERQLAGLLDAVFLLLAYGGFLGLFRTLGGRLTLGKYDAIVSAATLALFYAQYFALFTFFGGATPGMLLRGLRVVSFDGVTPNPRQLLWRSFGYMVSAGTLFLGFLWALWDEDHLTWQDRISQTYLTTAERLEETHAVDVLEGREHFAHK